MYWMSRDQRTHDNWALIHAQQLARQHDAPLAVIFCLMPSFLEATLRHYDFMLRGLREIAESLDARQIAFFLLRGEPEREIPAFLKRHRAAALVTDFSPLRTKRSWTDGVARAIDLPFVEVDTHNVVPCWVTSAKQEYGARTIRPKIYRQLDEFLDEFPAQRRHPIAWPDTPESIDWDAALRSLPIDRSVAPIDWAEPGEQAACGALTRFIARKLPGYDDNRNDPSLDGQSDLSPYIHFGQLSTQRIALTVRDSDAPATDKAAFLEELIVRRELSENFCFYNAQYDSVRCFPAWAAKTLREHADDPREHVYSRDELEQARTHDDAWNAAQRQMVNHGKMHGYMRMYWCKKILEWTESPEQALAYAIYLNDRYEIDGRDPNGYTNIAWSIGGIHDRAWGERPIFGKIRYMSYGGLKSKFRIGDYVRQQGVEPQKRSKRRDA